LTSHLRIGTLFCRRKNGGLELSNCEKYPVTATKMNCTKVSNVPLSGWTLTIASRAKTCIYTHQHFSSPNFPPADRISSLSSLHMRSRTYIRTTPPKNQPQHPTNSQPSRHSLNKEPTRHRHRPLAQRPILKHIHIRRLSRINDLRFRPHHILILVRDAGR
jgi:hypothetical protein